MKNLVGPVPRRSTWTAVGAFPFAPLVAIFALRGYAAFWTIPVRTWDDTYYRSTALADNARNLGRIAPAVAGALFPEARGGWVTFGYHDWLVVGLALAPADLDAEYVFQMVNLVFLLLQALTVYLGFRWAGAGRISLAAMALYLSMPVVFGLNRWVMTENHVMLTMLALPLLAAWFVWSPRASTGRELLKGIGVGMVVGVLSSTREYAAPTVLGMAIVIPAALCVARRFVAAGGMVLASSPYLCATAVALSRVAASARMKLGLARYFHSLQEVSVHALRYVTGIPQGLLLGMGLAAAVVTALAGLRNARRAQGTLAHELWARWLPLGAMLAVLAGYVALFVLSANRTARGVIPMVWTAIALLPLALRLGLWPEWRGWRMVEFLCLFALVVSGVFFGL